MSDTLRIATFTLSDTRTPADDVGGRLLRDKLEAAGFTIALHGIIREELDAFRETIHNTCDAGIADAIITTGGTGIAPRDRTIEVLEQMFEKRIDGFGEAFRRLSWDAIGSRAILSRAVAGVIRGYVVIALPGSPQAVELAVDTLIAPTLRHAVALASGRGGKHAAHGHHHAPGKHG